MARKPGRAEGQQGGKRGKTGLGQILGPGLVTGASDDDPSGIATYSQAGASFGYALGWTLVLTYPLMVAVQMISARMGRTTGVGIAANLRKHMPRWLLLAIVLPLLLANIANLGADLGAMADAAGLVTGWSPKLFLPLFALFCAGMEVMVSYSAYARVLKWLAFSLLAYVLTVILAGIDWRAALTAIAIPSVPLNAESLMMIVAIFGTTISPYLFFWQASQEAEETAMQVQREPLVRAPKQGRGALRRIRLDTLVGMAASSLVALAIIFTAAATLHNGPGSGQIESSAQAAQALRPIAGDFAFALFSFGIVGTGLLAVPVLAGSAAYAVGEALGWPTGLERKPLHAKAFYTTIAAATAIGMALNFMPINPIRALVWTAVVNGVVAVPVMTIMMLLSRRTDVMGAFVVSGPLAWLGWLGTAVMAASVVAMVVAGLAA